MPKMPKPSEFPEFPKFPRRHISDGAWGEHRDMDVASWRKKVQQACVDAGMSRNVARKVAKSV